MCPGILGDNLKINNKFRWIPKRKPGYILVANRISEIFKYRGADKSLARPGRKEITATEGFDVHIPNSLS